MIYTLFKKIIPYYKADNKKESLGNVNGYKQVLLKPELSNFRLLSYVIL